MDVKNIKFDYFRRYGVEMEINAFDDKDYIFYDKMPEGIRIVGNMVSKTLGEYVEVRKWGPTHWDKTNGYWVIKPDGSCGMELCSPIYKGWYGLNKICQVADTLKNNKVKADYRCSLHMHVDVSDLLVSEIANIIAYWIKCELVFMDAFTDLRKNNRYCQCIGVSDWIQSDTEITPEELVKLFGLQKYITINTYHYNKGKRPTVEFRIADNDFCLNSYFLKNWVKLIIHFVEMSKKLPFPGKYITGDPWSSFLWLDPKDVFKLLNWDGRFNLSSGMQQTRNWFIARIIKNLGNSAVNIHSLPARKIANSQMLDIVDEYIGRDNFNIDELINPSNYHEAVYDKIYNV